MLDSLWCSFAPISFLINKNVAVLNMFEVYNIIQETYFGLIQLVWFNKIQYECSGVCDDMISGSIMWHEDWCTCGCWW